MKINNYITKRVGYSILSLLGLSILVFVLARVLPGPPQDLAREVLGVNASQSAINTLISELHLNEPIPVQYYIWLKGIFTGNWGLSLVSHRNVLIDVGVYLPATLDLILMAAFMDVLFALFLGLAAGRMENTYVDHIIRIVTYVGIAIPSFVVAILLQLSLGYGLRLFPIIGQLSPSVAAPPHITGLYLIDGLITGHFKTWINAIWHLILPAFSLALGNFAQEARILRSAVIENQSSDFTLSETSHGFPQRLITTKYLLKPSSIPWLTIFGMDVAYMMANAFLIEFIFDWPGFSRYGLNAMLGKDLNAIIAVVMVIGIMFVVINAIVDTIVSRLDPRIGAQTGEEF